MYYHFEITGEIDFAIISGVIYDYEKKNIRKIFDAGVNLSEKYKDKKFTLIVDEENSFIKQMSDFIKTSLAGAGRILVVSNKASELFQSMEIPNLEYFDLDILSNKENYNYKIINVIGKIDCADREKSEIEYHNDRIYKVQKLVLDESKIPSGTDFFLLGPRRGAVVFISERVKKAIEENLEGSYKIIPASEFVKK